VSNQPKVQIVHFDSSVNERAADRDMFGALMLRVQGYSTSANTVIWRPSPLFNNRSAVALTRARGLFVSFLNLQTTRGICLKNFDPTICVTFGLVL
jgi:hypothetical protein